MEMKIYQQIQNYLSSFEFSRDEINKERMKNIIERFIREEILEKSTIDYPEVINYMNYFKSQEPIELNNETIIINNMGRICKEMKNANGYVNVIEDKYLGAYKIYVTISPAHMGLKMINFINEHNMKYKMDFTKFYKLYDINEDHKLDLYFELMKYNNED